MLCYNCGCLLAEYDYCTNCGADVGMYKKIVYTSNRFYNEGLEKANIRDLSGAIVSLRQSLKFDKSNIEARNLLGLVYFELGEVANALSEWVISQNQRPEKNMASDYIRHVQAGGSKLTEMGQAIFKYNSAYNYCLQGSKDLAVISLKGALAKNGQYVKAHLLLALLYMDKGEWENAEKEVQRALKVDRGSVLGHTYMQTIEQMLEPDEDDKKVKHQGKGSVRIEQPDGFIIQPTNVREPRSSGLGTLVNILIGLVIGAAAVYFLVVPARVSEVTNKSQESMVEIGNQLDTKTATIQELENKIASLEKDNAALNTVVDSYSGEEGTISEYDRLMKVAGDYILSQNKDEAASALDDIKNTVDIESMSAGYQDLYGVILSLLGPELAQKCYDEGIAAYNNGDYETAIDKLSKAYYYNTNNEDALFSLGNAYKQQGNYEYAVSTYEKVISNFPGTERATKSQQYINEINAG